MTFRGELLPATMRARSAGTSSASATILSAAAFALPRSAGARTRTLRDSPSHPAMPSREEAGTTLIGSLTVERVGNEGSSLLRLGNEGEPELSAPVARLRKLPPRHLEQQLGTDRRHGVGDAEPFRPAEDLPRHPARERRHHRAMMPARRVLLSNRPQAPPGQSAGNTHHRRPQPPMHERHLVPGQPTDQDLLRIS